MRLLLVNLLEMSYNKLTLRQCWGSLGVGDKPQGVEVLRQSVYGEAAGLSLLVLLKLKGLYSLVSVKPYKQTVCELGLGLMRVSWLPGDTLTVS